MLRDILYLSARDVVAVAPSPSEVLDTLRLMFLEKARGGVEMPAKQGIHPANGAFVDAMPASIPVMQAAGVKWIGIYPQNPERGLPHASGLIVTNDPVTGDASAILECGWITAARTAAASTLAAQYLAREGSSVLGVLGCGVQGRAHVRALADAFPIRRVLAYDVRREAAKGCAEEMDSLPVLSVEVVDSPRKAAEPADIIVTAGPITRPPHATIKANWLAPGLYATSVDYASYWGPDALAQFDRVVTDDLPQFAARQSVGYCEGVATPDCELASLIAGTSRGRCSSDERTFCCNLGIAAADIAVASMVVHRAVQRDIGVHLPR